MAHVAEWKKKEVANLVSILKESSVIGLANVDGIPAAQMQTMRKSLREDASIKISKNTLLQLALDEAGAQLDGIVGLKDDIDGSTAIVTTTMSPHRLYRALEASKTKAPIRAGQAPTEDIEVKKGDTPFKPGPVVGDLQKVGIPAAIDGGKVVIKKTQIVAKAGEPVSQEMASMLTRLEIMPMTVGMDLKAVFEDGTIYDRETLSVDNVSRIQSAHAQAINLAVFAGYPTKGTIELLLAKANTALFGVGSKLSDEAMDDELKEKLSSAAAASAAAPAASGGAESEAPAEEEEKEDEVSEEEAMGGLGALFG